jgi:putative salt-induced outer membrane protein
MDGGRGPGAQRWEVHEQSDYSFSARHFWFGAARYEDDRFSGFDYEATAPGFGKTDTLTTLNLVYELK